MNEITLEDTLAALKHDRYPVEVPEETRIRALRSIERMLAIG
jgi:quinolinate synthase